MNSSDSSAFVQEFFFFLSNTDQDELEPPIDIAVHVDLSEFEFTEAELQKMRKLALRLELSLLTEFTRYWSAASVVVEVRP